MQHLLRQIELMGALLKGMRSNLIKAFYFIHHYNLINKVDSWQKHLVIG